MKELNKIKITLNGVDYVAALGLGFIGSFLKEEKLNMSQFDKVVENNPIEYLPKMIYHAIKFNAFLEGEKEPEFREVLSNIHEEGYNSPEVLKVQEALVNSMMVNLPDAQNQGKQKAKK